MPSGFLGVSQPIVASIDFCDTPNGVAYFATSSSTSVTVIEVFDASVCGTEGVELATVDGTTLGNSIASTGVAVEYTSFSVKIVVLNDASAIRNPNNVRFIAV